MKNLAKAILPRRWHPLARNLATRLRPGTPGIRYAYQGMDTLSALVCTTAYNRYGGYCVPASSSHRPAAQAVLSGEVYEPQTIEYMIANCGSRDIVHAGTFFGDFLPALSGALDSRALIWAFEPNLENFRCARITLEMNSSSNVRLSHAGLGTKTERLFVATHDESGQALGGASHIISGTPDSKSMQPVEIVSIDEVIPRERDIGILQLDVEGHEREALSGALATIRRCLPILIIEVLPDSRLEDSEWFAANILGLGYRRVATLHDNVVYSTRS